jgi:hypothetical protein
MTNLRWTAVALVLSTGFIDIPYGWFFVAGYASYLWYAMGTTYIVIAGVLALNARPRLFQPLALGYGLFLLSAWGTGGSRDVVASFDKFIEVVLAVNMVLLIRATWPPITHQVTAMNVES